MKQWYLLYCKRSEQTRAKQHLENQAVECFYPEIKLEKIVRGVAKVVIEPLFPNYLFVCFDYQQGPSFTTIRSTRGVSDFIRCGAYPKVIDERIVSAIKQLNQTEANSGHEAPLSQLPQSGDVVEIMDGQYQGVSAIYQQADGEKRSMLLITLISKQVEVSVDNRHIKY